VGYVEVFGQMEWGERERETKAGKEGKKFCPCLCVSGEEDGVQYCLK
jgi:hypothetical protein